MPFSPSLGRPLWWWWGRTPIASGNTCPASHQPPPSLAGLKFQFGKTVMARKYGEEENWLGLRNESKDCKFVYGCIVLANTNITIFTLFILINSEELELLVGNSPPFVVDLSLWRLELPCQSQPPNKIWVKSAQLIKWLQKSRSEKADIFSTCWQNPLTFPLSIKSGG